MARHDSGVEPAPAADSVFWPLGGMGRVNVKFDSEESLLQSFKVGSKRMQYYGHHMATKILIPFISFLFGFDSCTFYFLFGPINAARESPVSIL